MRVTPIPFPLTLGVACPKHFATRYSSTFLHLVNSFDLYRLLQLVVHHGLCPIVISNVRTVLPSVLWLCGISSVAPCQSQKTYQRYLISSIEPAFANQQILCFVCRPCFLNALSRKPIFRSQPLNQTFFDCVSGATLSPVSLQEKLFRLLICL
ncbi:hypothetical protein ACHAW6_006774 [Cyclotella cf. meneghiniana]